MTSTSTAQFRRGEVELDWLSYEAHLTLSMADGITGLDASRQMTHTMTAD